MNIIKNDYDLSQINDTESLILNDDADENEEIQDNSGNSNISFNDTFDNIYLGGFQNDTPESLDYKLYVPSESKFVKGKKIL